VVPKSKHLKDAGITPRQAKDWEKLGKVPDDLFEQSLAAMEHPTTKGIIRANCIAAKFKARDHACSTA
jgi:hypothetical protein